MKHILTIMLPFFICCHALAQATDKSGSFECKINGKAYSLDLASAEFGTDIKLYGIFRMTFRFPPVNNRYGSVMLITEKCAPGVYKVGCCNPANYNEPYESEVSGRVFNASGEKSFSTRGGGNASGTITIDKVEDFYVWGSFDAYSRGEHITGKFEHVFVSDLTQKQFIEKK